jgi:ArsR family transcriptional regulator
MEQVLNIIKALADKNRLRVVEALTVQKELYVCQITEMLGLAMPTVSRHMSVLQKAGLVKNRKEGRWVCYRLSEAFPSPLLRWLNGVLASSHEVAKDMEKVRTIITYDLDAFCKLQKQRRARNVRPITRRGVK